MSRRVSYFYDSEAPDHYYGPGHPMKPYRLKLAHHLVLSYGLYRHLEMYRPHRATASEMAAYHTQDYVDFIAKASPTTAKALASDATKYNVGEYADCPIFDGLFNFCSLYCGGSIDGAVRLNHGLSDICINWSGGLHHAKKSEASGFCYMNDIVLSILELLKYHARVLYIDIDIHHGDGVEEAFYTTDRVMTCSFHRFGDFFPGTGDINDVGSGAGKYYAVNFPLKDGIGDEDFLKIFKPIIAKIMEVYRPGAIVLQCGADSLTGDRLGCFNLTLRGHGECVQYVKSLAVPLLVLGGGGYSINNVARCWAYETAVCLDRQNIAEEIPENDKYHEYYAPEYNLHLRPSQSMQNNNTKEYLKKFKQQIMQNLSQLQGAPSVAVTEIPPEALLAEKEVLNVKPQNNLKA